MHLTRVRLLAILLFVLSFALVTPAYADSAPQQVVISNVSGLSFSVSWLTSDAATGSVLYGTSPADISLAAYDTRDVDVGQASYRSTVHFVSVDDDGLGLAPNTTYYFKVVSNGTPFNNGSQPWQINVGPSLPASLPDSFDGQVLGQGGDPVGNVLVYITLRDGDGRGSPGSSAMMSTFVGPDMDGIWSASRANARTADLQQSFVTSDSGDFIDIQLQAAPGINTALTLDTGVAASGIQTMTLNVATTPVASPSPTQTPGATATATAQRSATPTAPLPTATATRPTVPGPAGPSPTATKPPAVGPVEPKQSPPGAPPLQVTGPPSPGPSPASSGTQPVASSVARAGRAELPVAVAPTGVPDASMATLAARSAAPPTTATEVGLLEGPVLGWIIAFLAWTAIFVALVVVARRAAQARR